MEKSSDAILYAQIRSGDKEALELLYDRYEKILFSFLYKMTGERDVAEEALQEVFIKLWRGQGEYNDSKGKFTSWLFRMAQNAAIDLIRKQKKSLVPLDEVAETASGEPAVETLAEWQDRKDQVASAVAALSEEQQTIINLFYFKGYTHEVIAELCGIPLGTVKSRIRLALKKLKKTLQTMQERGAFGE